ncbi:DUF2501 domain-containing protein [Enterobacteriaceae bacterium LUAb1]
MKAKQWMVALAVSGAVFAGQASATSWQNSLSSAANELSRSTGQSTTSGSGMSLSSLTSLLNGGNSALSSKSMGNTAGIMQFCVKNNIVGKDAGDVKTKLLNKLGLQSAQKQNATSDYQQGLQGLLNTGEGKQINLNNLGNTQIGHQVKTKACKLILEQAKNFIS